MKKNYLFALGAASMLLMGSCQNDSIPASVDTVPVKISVALPELQNATRATFGDGNTATKLYYGVFEVYDKDHDGTPENVYLKDISGVKDINITTDIVLQLMPKSSYKIAFWAASENAPYTCTFSGSDAYVTVDYSNILSNDENNDAFYGSTEINNVALDGGKTLIHNGDNPVQLVRPFAQLNIATSNKDYEDAEKAGFKVVKTEVVVSGKIYDRLNLWTGEAINTFNPTYHENVIPASDYTFPIVTEQKYLAMNYLLVPSDKQTAKVTFKYYNEKREKTREFDHVPVQRNWRTNIYGDLLTSTMQVNVEIAPLFADENGTDDDATVNPDNNEWYDQNRQ
jgi:hypothetical protein